MIAPSETVPLIHVRMWHGLHQVRSLGFVRSLDELKALISSLPNDANVSYAADELIAEDLRKHGWTCVVDVYDFDYVPPKKRFNDHLTGTLLSELLVRLKMSASKSEAIRLIKSGAVSLDDIKVLNPLATLQPPSRNAIISKGKHFREQISIVHIA